MVFYSKCGSETHSDSVFCHKCGSNLNKPLASMPSKIETCIEKTQSRVKKAGKVLGYAIMNLFLVIGTISAFITLVGLVLLQTNFYLFGGVVAGNPLIIAIVTTLAMICPF